LKNDSFSLGVIKRILAVLYDESSIRKTALASKTGLNYAALMRYLDLLKTLQWVEFTSSEFNLVTLTWLGRKFKQTMVDGDTSSGIAIKELERFLESSETKSKVLQAAASNTARAQKILLVDDEQDALFTYKLVLSGHGFVIDAFSNSTAALNHFRKTPGYYDLVITDIRMKPLNGLQLYQKIKMASPDTKVMFISALDAADELISMFPGIRVDNVIRKPVENQKLIKAVTKMLCN